MMCARTLSKATRMAGKLVITASVACFLDGHLVSDRLFRVSTVPSSCMLACSSSSILNRGRLELRKQYSNSSVPKKSFALHNEHAASRRMRFRLWAQQWT